MKMKCLFSLFLNLGNVDRFFVHHCNMRNVQYCLQHGVRRLLCSKSCLREFSSPDSPAKDHPPFAATASGIVPAWFHFAHWSIQLGVPHPETSPLCLLFCRSFLVPLGPRMCPALPRGAASMSCWVTRSKYAVVDVRRASAEGSVMSKRDSSKRCQ